jgi:hypothetical protein
MVRDITAQIIKITYLFQYLIIQYNLRSIWGLSLEYHYLGFLTKYFRNIFVLFYLIRYKFL